AEMAPEDRALAEKVRDIVTSVAPDLAPRTFYGMPAWSKNGKVVVFFQAASKYKVRYATLGFQPDAHLDDGNMWATSFAVTAIGPAEEKLIRELVERSEEHTSELQSRENLVCRLLLEKKKNNNNTDT